MNHFVFLFLFALIGYAGAEQIETQIYLASENNDKIGKNANYLFDEVGGRFEVKVIKPANSNTIKGFSIVYFSDKEDSWQFKFVIPAQQSIILGKYYKYAESYPYQNSTKAGIKVCRVFQDFNDLRGEFKILEYSLDSQGAITSLAIDFKQVAGNKGMLYGSIRFHSNKQLTTDFNYSDSEESSENKKYPNGYYPHFFEFHSPPGEYLGEGQHFISEDISFTPECFFSKSYLEISLPPEVGGWEVRFQAPIDSILDQGIYLNVDPFRDFSSAALHFAGKSYTINTLGSFEILEIEYNNSGQVVIFAVDFELHCLYAGNKKPLRGTIRYNSYIPPSTEAQIKAKLG